jgi:putative chitinase
MLTASQLVAICDRPINDNMRSVLTSLESYGPTVGMDTPARVAQYIAQLAHESALFRYDGEVWGPTAAQSRYEGRADLGNTQPGDGSKFRGYTAMQITGRGNTTAFYRWCVETFPGLHVPDFTVSPELMNTDPWEGLGPLWFWSVNRINRYADVGDNEMVSRTINGGLNGYDDRLRLYDRAALVLLDYEADNVRGFQRDAGLAVDGISGPKTRAAMHNALTALPAPQTAPTAPVAAPDDEQAAEARLIALVDALRLLADNHDPRV